MKKLLNFCFGNYLGVSGRGGSTYTYSPRLLLDVVWCDGNTPVIAPVSHNVLQRISARGHWRTWSYTNSCEGNLAVSETCRDRIQWLKTKYGYTRMRVIFFSLWHIELAGWKCSYSPRSDWVWSGRSCRRRCSGKRSPWVRTIEPTVLFLSLCPFLFLYLMNDGFD